MLADTVASGIWLRPASSTVGVHSPFRTLGALVQAKGRVGMQALFVAGLRSLALRLGGGRTRLWRGPRPAKRFARPWSIVRPQECCREIPSVWLQPSCLCHAMPSGFVTSAGALHMPKAALVIYPESGHGLLCQYPALFAHKLLRLVR